MVPIRARFLVSDCIRARLCEVRAHLINFDFFSNEWFTKNLIRSVIHHLDHAVVFTQGLIKDLSSIWIQVVGTIGSDVGFVVDLVLLVVGQRDLEAGIRSLLVFIKDILERALVGSLHRLIYLSIAWQSLLDSFVEVLWVD